MKATVTGVFYGGGQTSKKEKKKTKWGKTKGKFQPHPIPKSHYAESIREEKRKSVSDGPKLGEAEIFKKRQNRRKKGLGEVEDCCETYVRKCK